MPVLGDTLINLGNGATPVEYEFGGNDEVIPKVVNATFDGTSAGGDFQPVLIVTGPSGAEIARVPAPIVAAGASAEISWFPRVAATASTGTGFSWCTAASTANETIDPGPSSKDYFDLLTNDPAAFSLTGVGSGRIVVNKAGTYLLAFAFDARSHPGSPIANPWTKVLEGGPGIIFGSPDFGPESFGDAIGSAVQHWSKTWTMVRTVSSAQTGGTMNWNWNNLTGATLESAYGGVVIIRLAD